MSFSTSAPSTRASAEFRTIFTLTIYQESALYCRHLLHVGCNGLLRHPIQYALLIDRHPEGRERARVFISGRVALRDLVLTQAARLRGSRKMSTASGDTRACCPVLRKTNGPSPLFGR